MQSLEYSSNRLINSPPPLLVVKPNSTSKFGSGTQRAQDGQRGGGFKPHSGKFGDNKGHNNTQKPKKPKVINEDRYLDPENNKLNLHKSQNTQRDKKKTLNTKIRDLKKLIAHSEKKGITAIAESKKLELKDLTKNKRDKRNFVLKDCAKRKSTFIDQQYKHIKMYGRQHGNPESKRLRKQLKKLEADTEGPEREAKIDEVRNKIIYVKFYPRGERYISILKDDTLTEQAKKLRTEFWARATRYFEAYKRRVLKSDDQIDYHKDLVETDKFFMDDDEQHQHAEVEEAEGVTARPVKRLEVDKRGNVVKPVAH